MADLSKSMAHPRKRHTLGLMLATTMALSVWVVGCGPTLDKISSLETLRVLGVRKSSPYAAPGETVHLKMLWEDGRAELPPQVETFFGFWCLNPPGNSYAGCLTMLPNVEPSFAFNVNEFEVRIPEEALVPSPVPDARASGSAFVFYAVCAGTLEVADLDKGISDPEELVPRCLDEDGEQVGADDFMIGYSQIFIYEELRNENPVITGLRQGEFEIEVDCIDEECDAPFAVPELTDCQEGILCLETCEEDGDPVLCDAKSIEVIFDPASVEKDEVAADFGSDLQESIWVSYYIDRGSLSPELKLINDSTHGLFDHYSTNLYPPEEPGPVRVWAVVRDNRGGTTWLRAPGYVKARD